MIQLGGSKPEDNHPGYGNDLPGLENDDNWFFDFGIFDTTTDWMRGWGDDSSAQDNTGINSTFSERHLITVAPPPAGTTAPGRVPSPVLPLSSKPFVSPAAPGSACSDEGSIAYCPKHREDHQTCLPSVSPIKDLSSVEDFLPWGWQSGREEPKRRVTLPPLRQILEEYTAPATSQRADSVPAGNGGGLDERIRTDMVELLSIPYERYPYESADMSRFPPKKMLDGFITLYFEQFHSNLPVIHRPTFSVATCPTIVLVSMASIGASYSNVEGAKVFADTLSELCKRTLGWMGEYNPEYPRSDFYLKALCLQSVYALGSGSHRLYDSADVSRSFLIGNARRIGLFSGTLSPPASSPSSAPNSPGRPRVEDMPLSRDTNDQLEARWNTWRKQEELRRLAWSIFEYDCSFSTLSNRRGAITLNDISTRMPCSEALWEAPNAQAWAALLEPKHTTQSPCVERGTLLFPTLRDVVSEKVSPDTLTSWGKRLCAQALGRILWDFKEIEESVLSVGGTSTTNGGGLGLPMFGPGLKPAKDILLKSLMTLCGSIQKKQMDGGMRDGEVDGDRVHMILACLISHYTHLHAAFPTVSLILSLARRPPSSADTGADPRIARLKTIFSSDPVYARTLAWNSAQIIAISRWKPVFSPVEGMRIFMAGVVLWGFGRYFREPTTATTGGNSDTPNSPIRGMQEQIVRLDSHPWTCGVQGAGEYCPEEWIRNGGKKATIGNDDPDGNAMTEVCSERGAREVLRVVVGILGRMRVWGLGGEFKSVLEEMVRRT
ncbi:fungal-specific transcription factor domain-containing protein [Morchella snyderi]|nr:fungal-specific transcription factor domain-containing protein [Morchella snyderi]